MLNKVISYCSLLMVLAMINSSCSNTRFLADDQILYTGRAITVISDSGKFKDINARQKIEAVTAYQPNNAIGNKRLLPPLGLWIYNYRKPAEGKKPGWLYRTFSKEPVLLSNVEADQRCQKLKSELYGAGYFHSDVKSEFDISKRNPRKAKVHYYVKPGIPWRYRDISFSKPEEEIDSVINSIENDLRLKPDDIFVLETVQSEAKRITSRVLDQGYFYFNPSLIKWSADTSLFPYYIDLRIGKNAELIQNANIKYLIGDISVSINGTSDSLNRKITEDPTYFDGIRIISNGSPVKPEVISRAIYIRKGDIYSASKHQQTLTHLNSYGIFKFVNLQFIRNPDSTVNQMDVYIDLTLIKSISLDLEANVVTKSTGFAGPGFEAKLANGNVARGANRLQLKVDGGIEWQLSSKSTSTLGNISYNIGISTTLMFPKLIKPAKLFNSVNFNLPQTSVTAGFEILNKIQYYNMSSANLGLGYQWKKPDKITHIFYPLFFNSVALLKSTPEFDSILTDNPYIKKSFEEQFIAGMKYDFIYDNNITKPLNGFYFQTGIRTSGNFIDLMHRTINSETERPYSFLGNVYSQFLKLTTDIRYYRNYNNKSLVLRFYSGLGIPFSNSSVMPYVEQFYSGGSNSIRAYVARSLGPGGLRPDETSDIIDQTGDIKLEGNIEYRFKMSKVLHGALFLDAGNIWLLHLDENRPGAEFHFNTFTDQLYMGTGIGLRFDFSFFILRTDLGFPLRTAYLVNDSNWVRKSKDIVGKTVFNLAIGYPF